jgi:hypothetical protein
VCHLMVNKQTFVLWSIVFQIKPCYCLNTIIVKAYGQFVGNHRYQCFTSEMKTI